MLVEDRIGFIPCTDIDDALEDVHSRVSMCLDGNSNPAAKDIALSNWKGTGAIKTLNI
jgi:hypothetical protein